MSESESLATTVFVSCEQTYCLRWAIIAGIVRCRCWRQRHGSCSCRLRPLPVLVSLQWGDVDGGTLSMLHDDRGRGCRHRPGAGAPVTS